MSTDTLTAIAQAASEQLTALTTKLYAGQINLVQWGIGAAGVLKDAHLANAVYGSGTDTLNIGQLGRVGLNLADELRHLFDFARGIASGDVTEAQALARASQYGKASQQAYWREYAQAQEKLDAWASLPVLHNYPKDGQTVCRGNCNCQIRPEDDGLYWDLYPGESCEDCEALANGSPYRAR